MTREENETGGERSRVPAGMRKREGNTAAVVEALYPTGQAVPEGLAVLMVAMEEVFIIMLLSVQREEQYLIVHNMNFIPNKLLKI